jgi:hypothetical protein
MFSEVFRSSKKATRMTDVGDRIPNHSELDDSNQGLADPLHDPTDAKVE